MERNGLQLAALYAYGCQRTRIFGVDEFLREVAVGKERDKERIVRILCKLEPYLFYQLIAKENQIEDPLDIQVVRAYWLGGEGLKRIKKENVFSLIENKKILAIVDLLKIQVELILSPLIKNSNYLPHHNFTILSGLTEKNIIEKNLSSLDKCKVSWGAVTEVFSDKLTVIYPSLIVKDCCFNLRKRKTQIKKGFLEQVEEGDAITFHLRIGREIISLSDAKRLADITLKSLEIINQPVGIERK